MSITRLQQARQMYATGQRVAKTLDGSRPGYRGDAAYHSYSSSSVGSNRGTASKSDIGGGAASGPSGDNDRNDPNFTVSLNQNPTVSQTLKDSTAPIVTPEAIDRNKQAYLAGVGQSQLQHLYDTPQKFKGILGIPTPFSIGANLASPFLHKIKQGNIDFFRNKVLKSKNRAGYTDSLESFRKYMENRLGGKTDAYGNTHPGYYTDSKGNYISRGGGHDNIMQEEVVVDDTTTDDTTDDFFSRFLQNQPDDIREAIEARMQNYYTV
jgi:hypothetical protein